MILLKNFINIFFIPELRKKVLFTLGILIVYRFGNHIPSIGIDIEALQKVIEQAKGLGGFFAYLDMFSGGGLRECTLFALGVGPYITASIMMQMLGMTIPALEQLLKEGEYGRRKVNQYTRYLAFVVGLIQSLGVAFLLERYNQPPLVLEPGWGFRIMLMLSLTVGAMFVMWLGEQISQFGIGNGSSVIIFAGIVARFPSDVIRTWHSVQEGLLDPVVAISLFVLFVLLSACIVYLERAERKIPVQYTRRVVGNRVYGGQSTYIPFKINTAGVMPVIFASAVLNAPIFLISLLAGKFAFFKTVLEYFTAGGLVYSVLEFILIIVFSYVYTALIFNPDELSENIKKSGGFIPGIRPGKKTAEFFNYILTRIGLVGALYLGILALFPNALSAIMERLFNTHLPIIIGGTGLLIVVGVALDMAAQVESYLIENRYEGFLTTGKMKGRGWR